MEGGAGGVDPRQAAALTASVAWYDDVLALHGVPTTSEAGLWRALAPPPPFHSVAKTLRPGVDSVAAVRAAEGRGSVADSFADLDLPGFELLIEATWVHHAGAPGGPTAPEAWSVLRTEEELVLWSELHDYVGVLPPAVLRRPTFAVLGRFEGPDLVGGAVLHDAAGSVDLSNTWAAPGSSLDWAELLAAVHHLRPERPVTGFAEGEELCGLLDAGFAAVGPQRVWVPER